MALPTTPLTPEDRARVDTVFHAARALPTGDRPAMVHGALSDAPDLADEVRSLLQAADEMGRPFLDRAAVNLGDRTGTSVGERRSRTATDPASTPLHRWGGRKLGDRYLLEAFLAKGATGAVYRARDEIAEKPVAVKVLHRQDRGPVTRVELATLRVLRLPGVVRFLDEGEVDGHDYIVTEFVPGSAFPGTPVPCPWTRLRDLVPSLLDTLEHMHSAGVHHRDLKPANVLVDETGRVTVLDLGIAGGRAVRADGEHPPVAGTPGFSAPEQFRGEPSGPSADLYAVGAMLRWALTASADGSSSLPDDLPGPVRRLIDRLLSRDPSRRPSSAAVVREGLMEGRGKDHELPWLGPRTGIDAVVERVRLGKSVCVAGPPGSGRSRLLAEACAELAAEGYGLTRVGGSDEPFGSLRAALAIPHGDMGLEELASQVERHLLSRMEAGLVPVVDGLEAVDEWSRRIVRQVVGKGAAVMATLPDPDAEVSLSPCTRQDLHSLFHGPDRVHFLVTDAAAELWRRTAGLPSRVAPELERWSRSGHARREDGRWRVTRAALDRLAVEPAPPRRTSAEPRSRLTADDLRVAHVIVVAGASSTPQRIAQVLGTEKWQVDAILERLAAAGWITAEPGGSAIPWAWATSLPEPSPDARAALHRKVAQTLGAHDGERLRHVVAAGDFDAVPVIAVDLSNRALRRGHLRSATTIARDALAVAGRHATPHARYALLVNVSRAALGLADRSAIDTALHEIQRRRGTSCDLAPLETLLRGALQALGPIPGPTVSDALPPFENPVLEQMRHSVAVRAAQRWSRSAMERAVEVAETWAAAVEFDGARSVVAAWRAWLAYESGQFETARELHEESALAVRTPDARARALANAAAAAVDGFQLDRAAELAAEALEIASEERLTSRVLMAEMLLRQIRYRQGHADPPDHELVEATLALAIPYCTANALRQEAAFALRSRLLATAGRLGQTAAVAAREAGDAANEALALALSIQSGGASSHERARRALDLAVDLPHAALTIQVLALVAQADPGLRDECVCAAKSVVASIPADAPDVPREVLSVADSLDLLGLGKG